MQVISTIRTVCFFSVWVFMQVRTNAQTTGSVEVSYDLHVSHQTIRNFAASDAWAGQFVGNWPNEKKDQIADWLFSMDTLADGSPRGIGLSMWRYNIGAGSARQGDSSGIRDEWRRAAAFTDKDAGSIDRIRAQNWLLQAAHKRGVNQFLGFFNSPPVNLTKNGKAFATKGQCNIDSNHYKDFAEYAEKAVKYIKQATGIDLNYISPVNEPQWDWSDGGQEGCPYNNSQIVSVAKSFAQQQLKAQILLTESGHHKYLFDGSDKPEKDNQIHIFFTNNLPGTVKAIASHSYFSTSPEKEAVLIRNRIRDSVAGIPGLEYWQSEYCILGDNAGEINGSRRDTGMKAALYIAKVMYYDLVQANAAAWHWWLAISPYNYKDGLVYIDRNKTDGKYYDSKMLWAMGNYSRFVRPGMQRIEAKAEGLYVSAFKDRKQIVLVFVNPAAAQPIHLSTNNKLITYTTDKNDNLKKRTILSDQLIIPAESVVTVIIQNGKSNKR